MDFKMTEIEFIDCNDWSRWAVKSTVLPNTDRTFYNEKEAIEYAEYIESVAKSDYH